MTLFSDLYTWSLKVWVHVTVYIGSCPIVLYLKSPMTLVSKGPAQLGARLEVGIRFRTEPFGTTGPDVLAPIRVSVSNTSSRTRGGCQWIS